MTCLELPPTGRPGRDCGADGGDCLRQAENHPDRWHDFPMSGALPFFEAGQRHIRFVMDSLQKNTTEVRNMKQYLLAVLFNAPTTISNHYTAQVNHDMYAGGW